MEIKSSISLGDIISMLSPVVVAAFFSGYIQKKIANERVFVEVVVPVIDSLIDSVFNVLEKIEIVIHESDNQTKRDKAIKEFEQALTGLRVLLKKRRHKMPVDVYNAASHIISILDKIQRDEYIITSLVRCRADLAIKMEQLCEQSRLVIGARR